MKSRRFRTLLVASALTCGAAFCAAPAYSQLPPGASVQVNPQTKDLDIKGMTSQDLKAAIGYAAQNGDLDASDAKTLIDKITDIETLMDQFDFIRDQEKSMMSSIGSPFH